MLSVPSPKQQKTRTAQQLRANRLRGFYFHFSFIGRSWWDGETAPPSLFLSVNVVILNTISYGGSGSVLGGGGGRRKREPRRKIIMSFKSLKEFGVSAERLGSICKRWMAGVQRSVPNLALASFLFLFFFFLNQRGRLPHAPL